ncbi:MAG: agmatine deiminase family protein [Dysgonomonas sp.]|nr:agmatine deiminase family protein [Dysgonomonas sp.]
MKKYRVPGEFEPQKSVLIVWPVEKQSGKGLVPDEVSGEVVKALVGNVEVIVVCNNEEILQRAKDRLIKTDVDISLIRFYLHNIDNPYPRDFGAEVLIGDNGNKQFADFVFNEYCFIPNDPSFSFGEGMRDFNKFHAGIEEITDRKSTWLVSEGGDREFNGQGVMMAIEETEVAKRNPDKTKDEVEEEFKHLLNLEKIIWIPRATYDDENVLEGAIPGVEGQPAYRAATANGHIDEMCRFVDEKTILIAYISDEEAEKSALARLNKERLDEAYNVVSQATDINGKPFKIVKMPVPEPMFLDAVPGDFAYDGLKFFIDANGGKMFDGSTLPDGVIKVLPALSYCNFLISNNVVIAQKYWQEGFPDIIKQKDEEAEKILTELFPDRKVITISTLALNMMGGGIHCHTRNIPL